MGPSVHRNHTNQDLMHPVILFQVAIDFFFYDKDM